MLFNFSTPKLVLLGILASVSGAGLAADISVPGDYATIQAAVDAANAGDVITITGTFKEQVTINKSLTLKGAANSSSTIQAVVNQLGASIKVMPGTTNVNIENLSLVCIPAEQNTGQGGDNRLAGIWFQEASGTIDSVSVIDYRRNVGFQGVQEGNGIQLRGSQFENVSSWDNSLTITNCLVAGYQKTGILGNGNVKLIASGNTVTGLGPVDFIAQNGVQVGFGATAVVEFNDISGNNYTPASYTSCGILFYDASGVRARANMISGNERPLGNFGRGGGDVKAADES